MAQTKPCSPTCQFFRCGENAVIYRQDDVLCRLAEENCNIANCGYAICAKRRLLPKGICGETVKRQTIEKDPEDVIGPTVKLRGRTLRKFGEKEIF